MVSAIAKWTSRMMPLVCVLGFGTSFCRIEEQVYYPWHVRFLRELHVQTLREVLRMRQLTPEQIGIEYRALLDLIGEERVVDLIEEEWVVDLIGEERVVDLIGEERLVEDLLRRKGA